VSSDERATIQAVHRSLQRIRFEPRASLEAELLWRVRRDDGQGGETRQGPMAWVLLVAVLGILGALIYAFWLRLLTMASGSP
jgi:hypothetical protein